MNGHAVIRFIVVQYDRDKDENRKGGCSLLNNDKI